MTTSSSVVLAQPVILEHAPSPLDPTERGLSCQENSAGIQNSGGLDTDAVEQGPRFRPASPGITPRPRGLSAVPVSRLRWESCRRVDLSSWSGAASTEISYCLPLVWQACEMDVCRGYPYHRVVVWV